MKLSQLFNIDSDIEVAHVTNDSREVQAGTLFVAIKGRYFDGHDYLQQVKDAGAVAAIVSQRNERIDLPQFMTDDVMREMARCAALVYGTDLSQTFVGVTGTDGKTTTASLIQEFMKPWFHTGYIGTSGIVYDDVFLEPTLTTPLPPILHQTFKQMKKAGVNYIAMEASSHAQSMGRDASIPYTRAIFTNLTPDHLDYHETMDAYFAAKETIFRNLPEQGIAIINGDDAYGRKIKTNAKTIYYGFDAMNDISAQNIVYRHDGTTFTLHIFEQSIEVKTKLVADFNVYNILAVSALAFAEGIDIETIAARIEVLKPVEGRMEIMDAGQDYGIIIDMAHAPNSVEKVLTFAQSMTSGKIIAVTGCDGDRDRSKRPVIAKLCTTLADYTIFTEGDTYSEYVEDIVAEMIEGLEASNYEIEYDRALAIEKAAKMAGPGDVVFILGRGNGKYIPRRGEKIPFFDIDVAKDVVTRLMK